MVLVEYCHARDARFDEGIEGGYSRVAGGVVRWMLSPSLRLIPVVCCFPVIVLLSFVGRCVSRPPSSFSALLFVVLPHFAAHFPLHKYPSPVVVQFVACPETPLLSDFPRSFFCSPFGDGMLRFWLLKERWIGDAGL